MKVFKQSLYFFNYISEVYRRNQQIIWFCVVTKKLNKKKKIEGGIKMTYLKFIIIIINLAGEIILGLKY